MRPLDSLPPPPPHAASEAASAPWPPCTGPAVRRRFDARPSEPSAERSGRVQHANGGSALSRCRLFAEPVTAVSTTARGLQLPTCSQAPSQAPKDLEHTCSWVVRRRSARSVRQRRCRLLRRRCHSAARSSLYCCRRRLCPRLHLGWRSVLQFRQHRRRLCGRVGAVRQVLWQRSGVLSCLGVREVNNDKFASVTCISGRGSETGAGSAW